jgi:hypothetical protein
VYHDDATPHSGDLARARSAQAISRVAEDLDRAAFHAGSSPWTDTAVDCQAAVSHQATGPGADIALDHDLAARHFVADPVEAVAGRLDPDFRRIAHAEAENVGEQHTPARCLQFDPLDLCRRHDGEPVRYQRREIEALFGACLQGQDQRLHGSNSRRW